MYFIVGKTIDQNKQVISYLITDGKVIREVTPQQVYIEYQKGNLLYLKGFNTNTGEVDFKNIDNSLIPTFYNGSGINNNVSVLKILEKNNNQIGVRILVPSGEIMKVSLSHLIKLINRGKIQLFNAKVVNNKVVMKYAGSIVAESNRGNKEEVTINNYDKSKFVIDDNLMLIKYIGNDKEVIIPKGVISIGKSAFYNCMDITSITIPNSVISIACHAFYDCTNLKSIILPNGVTSIGNFAFCNCKSLTSITIPDGVTSIEFGVFDGCTNLKSITIPDSVTSIGTYAFRNCTNLKSITIPDSVTNIGGAAFCGCMSLTSIIIPDGVTSIGFFAFWECTSLTSINIPNSVTSIEEHAFKDCINLTSVTIPDSLISIGEFAFWGCRSLTSINIPDSVTSIRSAAFWACSGLTSITIPNSVTSIGNDAFAYWTSSQTIYIKGRGIASRAWHRDWDKDCNAKIVWDAESNNISKFESPNIHLVP